MSSNNELYNCDDTQYYASVEAEGSAIIPLSGTIVTATATSSATSGFSYNDAYEIANILAQQIASIDAQHDADVINQTLEIISGYSFLGATGAMLFE